MKKLFFALLAIAFISTPVVADNWTINFTTQGDADHISLFYGIMDEGMSAQDFIGKQDLVEIPNIPIESPQEFAIDYPDGTKYGIFGKVFDSNGDSVYFMSDVDGNLSPIVWSATAIPEIIDAHYEEVIPSVGGTNVINITINQGR